MQPGTLRPRHLTDILRPRREKPKERFLPLPPPVNPCVATSNDQTVDRMARQPSSFQ